MDWLLSLIAAVLYPLAAVPIQRIGKRVRRASGGMQETMGETAAMLNESFAQARTVRAYRLEEVETKRADERIRSLYRALLRMARKPVAGRAGAGGAGRRRRRRGDRRSPAGAPRSATTRSAISAASSAALLMASRPLRALGSLNAALQEGLAGPGARVRRDRRTGRASWMRRTPCRCRRARPCAVRGRELRLSGRPRRAARPELRGAARADRGAGRPVRGGEVDRAGADPSAA